VLKPVDDERDVTVLCFLTVGNEADVRIITDRKQISDIGKYPFVNRTTKNWNQLPAESFGTFPCKPKIF
jgi:hypothetical protein